MPTTMHRLVLALLLPVTSAVAQQGCLDQSYLPTLNNGLEVTANQTVAQTFTVGRAGTLATVEIARINHHRGTPTQNLEVRIVATDANGTPNGATLASTVLLPAQVPATSGTLSVDVRSAAIAVVPGMVLGIRLSSLAAPSSQTYAWWGTAPGATYANGQTWINDNTSLSAWDLSFQTFVDIQASASNYGSGHPGTFGVPTIQASATPVIGTAIDIVVGNASGAPTQAALFAGLGAQSLPTPFGGTLLVQIDANLPVALSATDGRVTLSIPNNATLCGASVYFQAVHADAAASAGLAFTPGLALAIGS